jgi:NAD(P)-dependent dehydrogenase (short-subunit alcohol dehydrogenase family)
MRGFILAANPRRPTLLNIRPGGSEQRTAIVTGAARGIGAATALALAMRGIAPALLVRDATAATGIADRIRMPRRDVRRRRLRQRARGRRTNG